MISDSRDSTKDTLVGKPVVVRQPCDSSDGRLQIGTKGKIVDYDPKNQIYWANLTHNQQLVERAISQDEIGTVFEIEN